VQQETSSSDQFACLTEQTVLKMAVASMSTTSHPDPMPFQMQSLLSKHAL